MALAGCAGLPEVEDCGPVKTQPSIWLSETLIHTQIGLRVSDLRGRLAELARDAPDSAFLTFGFGKRSYFLAAHPRLLATFFAPVPGRGAMEVGTHFAKPQGALTLGLSPLGLGRLLAALEGSFAGDWTPLAERGRYRYFAASRLYTLAYTCNTWTAEMLASAELPVQTALVVTAHGVMTQAVGGCREPRLSRQAPRF